jgi:hypothetical protein
MMENVKLATKDTLLKQDNAKEMRMSLDLLMMIYAENGSMMKEFA